MKTIVDTSALIAFLRLEVPGETVAHLLEAGEAVVPSICVFELLTGVKDAVHLHQRRRLVALSTVAALDERVAGTAAELLTALRGAGRTIDNEDLLVAATALHLRLPVLTVNRRHFDGVPGLALADAAEAPDA